MSRWALCSLALILPFEPPDPLLRAIGFELSLLELGAALALGVLALSLFRTGAAVAIGRAPLLVPALAFLGACLLSAAAADPPRLLPFKFSLRVGAGVAAFALAAAAFRERGRLASFLGALAAAGVVVSGIGFGEWLGVPPLQEIAARFREQDFEVGGSHRLAATFGYPNTAAGFLVLALAAALFFTLRRDLSARRRGLALAGALAIFIAILFTYSRGALAGALAVPAAFAVLARIADRREESRRLALWVGLFIGLALLHALVNPYVRLRAVSEGDASWYRASFAPSVASLALEPGELVRVPVTVRNEGRLSWASKGEKAFHLSYHWYDPESGGVLELEGERTRLPGVVVPGDAVRLDAYVRAPSTYGRYLLVWDMVQEHTTWFVGKGGGARMMPVFVGGADRRAIPLEPRAELDRVAGAITRDSWFPGRLELWSIAAGLFLERPLLGVGPDNFRWLYGPAAGRTRWDRRTFSNSLYLETLATTGLAGAAAFFTLVGGALLTLVRSARAGGAAALPAACVGAALAGFLVHGLFDYLLAFTPIYLAFYLLLGGASSIAAQEDWEHADRI